jgi:protein O-mannosyl-transferase
MWLENRRPEHGLQPRRNRSPNWLYAVLLVAAIMVAYQPAWRAGFVWDDDAYVTQNELLSAPDGLWRIWFSLDSPSQYFPLTYTMLRFEHGLWGSNPAGYHWINILTHAANALLVWRLLVLLGIPGSWLAAALFALHPVHVESVAWISEQKNLWSLCFSLLALIAWVKFIETQPGSWRFYVLSLVLYSLALFSKTVACTLPAALVLILWLERKPLSRARAAQIVPFVLLGIGVGLITVFWERYHQGTQGRHFALGLPERILVASHAIWFYAGKLVWPVNLVFSYPKWDVDAASPLSYGWLAALAAVGFLIGYARRFFGRSVEVAVTFYVAMLSPLLGFIMLYTFRYSFVADHYQYAASIGPIALSAAGITKVWGPAGSAKRHLALAICAALVATLGVLTWRQAHMYKDLETLWRTTLARNPDSWLAHNNLGGILLQRGHLDDAFAHFEKVLELEPSDKVANNNVGQVLFRRGSTNQAIAYYRKALQEDPGYQVAHYNLAVALLQTRQYEEAIVHLRPVAENPPDRADVQKLLGTALFQTGHVDEAIQHYEQALAIQPTAEIHSRLGAALVKAGRLNEAIPQVQKALQLQPWNADLYHQLANVAWVLTVSRDPSVRNGARAVELAQQADLLFSGQDARTSRVLAAAYAEAGRFAEANRTAEHALQLALAGNNSTLAARLRQEVKLYQANSSLGDSLRAEPIPGRAP